MAEAEDVITDAARHATVFARDLWQRHLRAHGSARQVEPCGLADLSARLGLLVAAAFGTALPIRIAQAPARPTLLLQLFRRDEQPRARQALPATDGVSLWLPAQLGIEEAAERYRVLALSQAARAFRGSAAIVAAERSPLLRDLCLVLEAYAGDENLARVLPGVTSALNALRRAALDARPPLHDFPPQRRPLEQLVRRILQQRCGVPVEDLPLCATAHESLVAARALAAAMRIAPDALRRMGASPLFKDLWTGELRVPTAGVVRAEVPVADLNDEVGVEAARVARLARRPQVREKREGEDDRKPGAWMIQSAQPHEHVEDSMGMQRPTDRDEETAAEDFADSLSELPEARLVTTPGRPKEVLLSDDPPERRARAGQDAVTAASASIAYPEWDYRTERYRVPGAIVRLLAPKLGSRQWVERTLAEHGALLQSIRRRFEMLRAQRQRLRKQLDGEDIDLEAYIDGQADFHAGRPMGQALYQTRRTARRDIAVMLLIDVSGSTDAWVSAQRRVIDVEREALLLVCIALEGMAESYSVHAFSGEGPGGVIVRDIKRFDERYSDEIAQRIAALEPERYTRTGAAIRHATALLMREPGRHRLLLLLSDGKPNDIDDYDGRYGVEDLRQAVVEAKLQGIFAFCLTIDRQGADYLPKVFGAGQYALLADPDRLPAVLLDWMKRLIAA